MSLRVLFAVIFLLKMVWNSKHLENASGPRVCICSLNETSSPQTCCDHMKIGYCSASLDDLPVNNSSMIAFCEHDPLGYWFSKSVSFVKAHDIYITGLSSMITLNCSYRDAGFGFFEVSNVTLKNLKFIHCGALHRRWSKKLSNITSTLCFSNSANVTMENITMVEGNGTGYNFTSTLCFSNSANVTMENITIVEGNGTGLFMINTYGFITGCKFAQNRVRLENDSEMITLPGGGGIFAEYNLGSHLSREGRKLIISKTNFSSNLAKYDSTLTDDYVNCENDDFIGLGKGGGMAIYIRGINNKYIQVELNKLEFHDNSAEYGGGLYIHFCNMVFNNTVKLQNSNFIGNQCKEKGGGGVNLGFSSTSTTSVYNSSYNSVHFINCTFRYNKAFFGGGVALFAKESRTSLVNNTISFLNCTWDENFANYGAAIDSVPLLGTTPLCGHYPNITLTNSTILNNIVIKPNVGITHEEDQLWKKKSESGLKFDPHQSHGKGTVVITAMKVHIKGYIKFVNNNESAIYAILSIIEFLPNVQATFNNNSGFYGGAIALLGHSALILNKNVSIVMTNNTASNLGGAIYHFSIDKHDYLFSHSCFIQAAQEPSNESGIEFMFSGNIAGHQNSNVDSSIGHDTSPNDGNDIYATTVKPCFNYCHVREHINISSNEAFKCIGKFDFGNSNSVATSGRHFINHNNSSLSIVPGKVEKLNFYLVDDFHNRVRGVYHITTLSENISVDDVFTHTAHSKLAVKGRPGASGMVRITKVGFRETAFEIEVTLSECPPFFIYDKSQSICRCAGDVNAEFNSIHYCNHTGFFSFLLHGFWVGNDPKQNGFLYGKCPEDYCFKGNEVERFHKLPESNKQLDEIVCGGTRTGLLCGDCRKGHSVHYHSSRFKCGTNQTCNYGWLFYIISEVIPLMVLFLIVITFNINFTSGYLNGFILYAQVFDSLFSIGKTFVFFAEPIHRLIQVIEVIYKVFNFDFFGIDYLSFCLWNGATTLGILTFKFVTVIIALILVVTTVLLMKRCSFPKCKLTSCKSSSTSMIHGLSAFLVMVYMQCTKISFQILNLSNVSDLNGNQREVLFYQGNMIAFSRDHAPYAFLAFLCLFTLTALPPLLLIIYPLCYKISAFFKLENTKFTKTLGVLLPVSRLKPMLDSFQGSFRDRYRHFAGLYFLYRIGLLSAVLATNLRVSYAYTQLQLILILAIHGVCLPYVKRVHNIIDTLIFSNLVAINAISIFNYNYGQYGSVYQRSINFMASIQTILVYSPFLVLLGYIVIYLLFKYVIKHSRTNDVPTDDVFLERIEDIESESFAYKEFSSY